MTRNEVEQIVSALLEISFGDRSKNPGPGGLEGVALALKGPGDMYKGTSVAEALLQIGEHLVMAHVNNPIAYEVLGVSKGLDNVVGALDRIAEALVTLSEQQK